MKLSRLSPAVAVALAATLLVAAPATARPGDAPDWEREVVDPARWGVGTDDVAIAGDVGYALTTNTGEDDQVHVLHGLSAQTGEERWTLEDPFGPGAPAAVLRADPQTQAVVGLAYAGPAGPDEPDPGQNATRVTSISPDGRVKWSAEGPDGVSGGLHLDVDETTGTVCMAGNRWSARRWFTSCWTREGDPLGTSTVDARSRGGIVRGVLVDAGRNQVLAVGTTVRDGRWRRTVLTRSLDGSVSHLTSRTSREPFTDDLTLDASRGVALVLSSVGRRTVLDAFDLRTGRYAWSRSLPGRHGSGQRVEVLGDRGRIAVLRRSPKSERTRVDLLTRAGRPERSARIRACCEIAGTGVSPSGRLVVVTGRWWSRASDEGISVHTVDDRGRVRGGTVVEPLRVSRLREAVVDPSSGMVLIGAETAPDAGVGLRGWLGGVVVR